MADKHERQSRISDVEKFKDLKDFKMTKKESYGHIKTDRLLFTTKKSIAFKEMSPHMKKQRVKYLWDKVRSSVQAYLFLTRLKKNSSKFIIQTIEADAGE